jgi:N-acetylglucosaminyldiphosphoundecaprenol N-acetyl-beta-D-mannosaminyltransferase
MTVLNTIPCAEILGIKVNKLTMDSLLDLCNQHIEQKKRLLIGVVNVAKLVNAGKDPQLRKSLDSADIVLADGCGIVWLSKLIGKPLPERVAGIDIMYRLLEHADGNHYGVYFLGAKREVVDKVVDCVKRDYSGVQIAGHRDGFFDESDEQTVAENIRKSKADILFVAMSSPKKENFLSRWYDYMNVPVCHGVGGSFDVVAGITKRAPVWMQSNGLEWLYRMLQEPRRMWKRYLITNTVFLRLCLVEVARTYIIKLQSSLRSCNNTR